MDNLTHTIAGLWTGEFAHRFTNREGADSPVDNETSRKRRLWFLWLGASANNFPDLDLVFYNLLPDPHAYLLHHRGHTHTLVFALLQAALILAIFYAIPAFRRFWKSDKVGRITSTALVILGTALHIGFDSFNSYGVHPFWPINSNWFYGDIVFIIEPTIWFILGLPFIFGISRKWVRQTWYAFLFGIAGFFLFKKLIPPYAFGILMTYAATLFAAQRFGKTRMGGVLASVACFAIFIFTQSFASKTAAQLVISETSARFNNENVLDHALTPLPSNPLCWTYVSVSSNGPDYFLRRGTLALAPNFIPVADCKLPIARFAKDTTIFENENVRVFQEAKFSTRELASLSDTNCWMNGWLRFVRTPAFDKDRANDWRFIAQGEDNFSTMRFADFKNIECRTEKFPTWIPPRKDLLDLGRDN